MSSTNRPLDGDSDGTPGGDFVRFLDHGSIAAVIVDRLLASGLVSANVQYE